MVRMRDFSLPLTVRSVQYVASRGGWFRRRSHPTWPKTRIIPVRVEQAFTLAKNQWKTGGVSKNHTSEVGFSIPFFFAVFRGSFLATSNDKPECEKNSGFFYASVNGSNHWFKPCKVKRSSNPSNTLMFRDFKLLDNNCIPKIEHFLQ